MNRIKTLEIHKPGVYAIHNKRNDKYYIGSTNDLCNRTTTHRQNMYNGTVNMKMLPDLIGKGVNDFEFLALEVFEDGEITESYLRRREGYYIKKYQSDYSGYNSCCHMPAPHPVKGNSLVYSNDYKNKINNICVLLPKGKKAEVEAAAKAAGKTLNAFCRDAVLGAVEKVLNSSGSAAPDQLPEQEEQEQDRQEDLPPFME